MGSCLYNISLERRYFYIEILFESIQWRNQFMKGGNSLEFTLRSYLGNPYGKGNTTVPNFSAIREGYLGKLQQIESSVTFKWYQFKEKSYPYQKDCQKDPCSCNFCRSFLQTAPNSPENIKKFLSQASACCKQQKNPGCCYSHSDTCIDLPGLF